MSDIDEIRVGELVDGHELGEGHTVVVGDAGERVAGHDHDRRHTLRGAPTKRR